MTDEQFEVWARGTAEELSALAAQSVIALETAKPGSSVKNNLGLEAAIARCLINARNK